MKSSILTAIILAAATAAAYAQTTSQVAPYQPGEVVTLDTQGNQVLIVSCGIKNNVPQCGVRQGRNGEFGNGQGDMWVVDIVRKENAYRAAKGLGPRNAAAAQPSAAKPSQNSPLVAATPNAAQGAAAGQGKRCFPATPYAGALPASRPASAALFQQLIANKFTSDGTPAYPRSVQFQAFSVGPTVVNQVGVNAQGANRVTNGAPAGVQMTSVKATFTVCREEYTAKARYDSTYFCWKAGREWACGVSESKVTTVK